jgi:hypothetical protein
MSALRTLSAAAAAGLICLAPVLVPAGTGQPDAQPVTVSLLIVETTPEALADAENALGFSLDPMRGRCMLDADEHATLAMALAADERSRVLARAIVVCIPQQEALLKAVETIRVPERYEAVVDPDAPGKLQVRATEYTTREIGLSFGPTVSRMSPGGELTLIPWINLSRVSGWREVVPGINEPIIKNWELVTTVRLRLGTAVAFVNRPYQPFEPPAEPPAPGNAPRPQPVVLVVIGVE